MPWYIDQLGDEIKAKLESKLDEDEMPTQILLDLLEDNFPNNAEPVSNVKKRVDAFITQAWERSKTL